MTTGITTTNRGKPPTALSGRAKKSPSKPAGRKRVTADGACNHAALRERLDRRGIELICPHRESIGRSTRLSLASPSPDAPPLLREDIETASIRRDPQER
jgi:hypothetical protein